jgi:hypothetical protein
LYYNSLPINVLLNSASILLNTSKQGPLGRYNSSNNNSKRQAIIVYIAATAILALALASCCRARDLKVIDIALGREVGLELTRLP